MRINFNMKSLLLNIKNLIPYLLLISLYFLFINIEARKELTNYTIKNNTKKNIGLEKNVENINLRISIPVIPYSQ